MIGFVLPCCPPNTDRDRFLAQQQEEVFSMIPSIVYWLLFYQNDKIRNSEIRHVYDLKKIDLILIHFKRQSLMNDFTRCLDFREVSSAFKKGELYKNSSHQCNICIDDRNYNYTTY